MVRNLLFRKPDSILKLNILVVSFGFASIEYGYGNDVFNQTSKSSVTLHWHEIYIVKALYIDSLFSHFDRG